MTQHELVSIVAEKIQASVESTTDLMTIILSILSEELIENGLVFIEDFGVFKTQKRSEYVSLNSTTGERLLMPPAIEIVFESFLNASMDSGLGNADITKTDTTKTGTININANNDNTVIRNYCSKDLLFEPELSLKNSVNSAFVNFEPTVLNDGVELLGLEMISDIPLTPHFPVDNGSTYQSKTEVIIPEHIASQVNVKTHHTNNAAPPIKQRSSNSRIWMPIMGGVAITMAALFFFNGTTQKKCK